MSMCPSAKHSSFSVRDILDLPEAPKSPCSFNTPGISASLPPVSTSTNLEITECPQLSFANMTYGGLFNEHFPKFPSTQNEDMNPNS
ncbi:hypothetical protein NPIL_653091, partial [Nephila pilipes]